MTSSFTSVPLSFDDNNNNKTNKTNNTPSSWQGHPYQQDNNMYSNSRPVETPPSASFSSGIQFQRALNPNPDTADRWGNGNNRLVGPNAPTVNAAATAAASPSSSSNRGSSFLRSKAQRDSVSSWRMNDPKQTQEAATRSTSTTFGFSAPSLSHEKSSMLPTGYNPTSTSAMPSSSMLGLRQRRGAGNPPPKRSMMTMKIEMNTNKSLEELALTKGMNLTATSKAAATTTTTSGTENLDDSFLLSDYNKENDFMGNTSSIVPAIASKPTSTGTFLFAQNSTTQQEPEKQQPQQETRQQQHASTHPFHSGQLEYSRWVVLYGFTSPSQCLSILRVFGKFGTIVSKYPSHPRESSAANWMCVQYESSLQADKALCQHGTFLDVSNQVTILGVMRMDQVVAERLGLIHYWMNGVQEETVTTEYYTQGEKDSMKKDASVTKDSGTVLKTTTLSERDVLLTGKERIKKRIGGGRQQDIGNALLESSSQPQGLLYKILAWFFEW